MQEFTDRLVDQQHSAIETVLTKWVHRFPLVFDEAVFKEKDRILSIMEEAFITQRSPLQIAKLACRICFARKRLANNGIASFAQDQVDIQIVPMVTKFPLGSKATLGILSHANVQNQYEHFRKNQVLNTVQKLFPETQVISDSVYEIQPPRSTIQTVYFEICKHSGLPFSFKEVKQLRDFLKQELPYSIEKVAPSLFMLRNEEELFKNIFSLSNEIHRLSDPPQVMILFEQQTQAKVDLTVILVCVRKEGEPSLRETIASQLSNAQEFVECWIDRWQTVRYMRKHHPVEAGIIKLRIDKQAFPRRGDGRFLFHLVRQKASQMLTTVIGCFRDYNGGLIVKQIERITSLKKDFPDVSQALLENFYYSLNPIESQATLSKRMLRTLFKAFLATTNADKRLTDPFMQITSLCNNLLISIRVPDPLFTLNPRVFTAQDLAHMVSYTVVDKGACLCGYVIAQTDLETKERLQQAIAQELDIWRNLSKQRQVLRLNLFSPVVSFDPRMGGDRHSSTVLKLLFEGLMRTGMTGNLEYGVAQRVDISSDQKTYTFRLKHTVWSNGTPVTAKDFEHAWKTILSPSFKTSFTYLLYPIKNARLVKNGSVPLDEVGIRATEDYVLTVELEVPAPYFLASTALTVYSPIPHTVDQQHPSWPQQEGPGYVCNGAFCLTSNNLNDQHVLTKNPLYWDFSSIRLDEIVVLRSNVQTPFAMFQEGLVDWAGTHLTTNLLKAIPSEETEVITTGNLVVYWIVFNTTKFPFHNTKLRQALSMGINRQKLQDLFGVLPAISPLPPMHSQVKESLVATYSLKAARKRFDEALEELNLTRADFSPIQIIHTRKYPHPQIMAFIKEEWEQAFGIRCELKVLTWDRFFSECPERDFQVAGTVWEACIDDPSYTLNTFLEGGRNLPKWIDPQYRQIIYKAEKEISQQKRRTRYAQAEQILVENMPIAPLFYTSLFAIKKKSITTSSPLSCFDLKWSHFM